MKGTSASCVAALSSLRRVPTSDAIVCKLIRLAASSAGSSSAKLSMSGYFSRSRRPK